METSTQNEYTAFEEKVGRTMYIDNLAHKVNTSVLKSAFDQFGNVTNIEIVPNYIESRNIPQCALVEMETADQAKSIIIDTANCPFMIFGMPRPVRARMAEVEMFGDRPMKPGCKKQCRWIDRNHPDFEEAKKLKRLTSKHAAEASFMLKRQLEEEEKLANEQAYELKRNYKKYQMIETIMGDGTAARLAKRYGLSIKDD